MSRSTTRPDVPAAGPGPPRAGGRQRGRMARLALKELRETLRDRRTIGTLLLMPVLVYPLLSLAFQKFLLTQLQPVTGSVYHIAVESDAARETLGLLLAYGHVLVEEEGGDGFAMSSSPERPAADDTLRGETVEIEVYPDVELAVAQMEADLGLRLTWHGSRHVRGGMPLESAWEILAVEGSPRTRAAYAFVDRRLQAASIDFLRERLASARRSARLPVRAVRQPVKAAGGVSPFSLGTLVPLILILMTMTGAVYPAIDLTAGERERGTLEALIAAPVPRMGLLLAKYVAVLAVALLTAGVNLAAMTATVVATGLGPVLFGEQGLSLAIVASIVGLLVLLAAFFSAVLLALTSFARSFKEAQAYLIPLMLVSLAPGMLSLVPGLKLNGLLAVAPLANIVLLARDLFDHAVDPLLAVVVVGSTAVYAVAAISVAARVFGTDAILYGSEGSWSDVFRRPAVPRPAPTVAAAMFCLAVLFPLSVFTSATLKLQQDLAVPVRLLAASLATAALFGGVPLAVAGLRRVELRTGFGLRAASALAWSGALLLGVSLWPLAYELTIVVSQLTRSAGLELFDARLVEHARRLVDEFRTIPPAVVVLSLAVAPALFEELFFRGFLYAGLRQRYRPAGTIVASAVLFGLFHVVLGNVLAPERIVPSTALGLILGWLRHRSGSVLPGTLLHACHNAFLLSLVYYQDRLESIEWLNVGGWMTAEAGTGHLPPVVLAAAVTLAAAGAALVWRIGRDTEDAIA